MPRPLRDQSPGVVHLIWRGVRGERVFDDDVDRTHFVDLLADVCDTHGWRLPAYCLMRNHVHLMAVVTAGTLSHGMQSLGSRYAQRYDARHGFAGHLFERRFRSERVETDSYGLELARYIDLNPERAGAVSDAADAGWSSHRALIGFEAPRRFHDVDWVLGQFADDRRLAQQRYAAFVADGRRRARPSQTDMAVSAMARGQTPRHGPNGQGPPVAWRDQPAP